MSCTARPRFGLYGFCSRVGLLGLLLAASGSGCAGATQSGASAPVFATARQAEPAGAAVYERECASCHGDRGEGGGSVPVVMGRDALAETGSGRGSFRTARDVFEYVRSQMPLPKKRAGSLGTDEYWAVTAFLVRAHGTALPPGGLTPDNAASVVVTR